MYHQLNFLVTVGCNLTFSWTWKTLVQSFLVALLEILNFIENYFLMNVLYGLSLILLLI